MDWTTDAPASMNGYALISELVRSLAWPVATVIGVLLLRRPALQLIPLLRELEWKGVKARFSAEVQEAAAVAKGITGQVNVTLQDATTMATGAIGPLASSSDFKTLALIERPDLAVLEAWAGLENAVITKAKEVGLPLGEPHVLMREMADRGLVTPRVYQLYLKLGNTKNIAAHRRSDGKPVISAEDAITVLRLTQILINDLKNPVVPTPHRD